VATSDDRRRILDMLGQGQITVDDAANLLKAIGPTTADEYRLPPQPTAARPPNSPMPPQAPSTAPSRRLGPRLLRIQVDEVRTDGGKPQKVRVNVPLALAKFAMRFVPVQAQHELASQGIEINEIFNALSEDMPDGKLIDVEADRGDGTGHTHITIEVI